MRRIIRVGWVICLLGAGCATAPPTDNPVVAGVGAIENPVLVSPGVPTREAYMEVFEKVVQIVGEYFDLLPPTNPYAGEIVTKPRIAPGYDKFWMMGNPDPRSRLLSTFQTVRQTATVEIRASEHGGFLVYVVVDRELEDLARPTAPKAGGAIFDQAPTVARPWDIVNRDNSTDQTTSWFKVGRDYALEQDILRRIRKGQ